MINSIDEIKKSFDEKVKDINSLNDLENLRLDFFGKKGQVTELSKIVKDLSNEEKPVFGKKINELKNYIENFIKKSKVNFENIELEKKLKNEKIDVTIKGKNILLGKKHPITIVTEELQNIFLGMGYEIAEGPEIETEYYNFEALNIKENHPARDEQDTFYVEGGFLLRTQTSPVQIRIMENKELPIKIIAPGRVFRSDDVDATHSPVFHQLEGLFVGKNVSMADLKYSLEIFAKEFLGENTKVRFRPHHFPFTEPSAEMDATCFVCSGKGCRVCKNSGWIELLGCGMVHPNVLKNCNIDPEIYSGFAFGMGIDRIAMLKFGVNDLRLFYENDLRFLKQF